MNDNPVAPQDISRDQLADLARAGYLYAIVDATDQPAVPPKMDALGHEHTRSLFRNGPREAYWAIAPISQGPMRPCSNGSKRS